MYKIFFFSAFLGLTAYHNSIIGQGNPLTIEQIMQGNDFIGHQPSYHRVLPNDNLIFEWQSKEDIKSYTYVLDGSGKQRKLTSKELFEFPLYGFEWNKDRTEAIYCNNGNLILWKVGASSPSLLIRTSDYLSNAKFSMDEKSVFYKKGNDLFEYNLASGTINQITNFDSGSEPSKNEKLNYLEKQQEELFEIVQKRKLKSELSQQQSEEIDLLLPRKIYTKGRDIYNLEIDPLEKYVVYSLVERAKDEKTIIQDYVTKDGYAKDINARPKVGKEEDKFSLHYYDIEKREVTDIQIDELSQLNKIHKYLSDYNIATYTNKGVIFHGPYFNDAGTVAVVEIKSLDNKHRWLAQIDFKAGKLIPFEYQYDEAWIGGPGISGWNEEPGNVGFLKGGNVCYFQSEESGYSHLYTYDFDNKKKKALTNGNFEIHQTQLSNDGKTFYITANKTHPGNRGFYHLDIKSGKWTDILVKDGNHEVVISKDESKLFYTYSFKNKPTELFSSLNAPKNEGKQLTHSTYPVFDAYQWIAPEVVKVKAADGAEVYARLYEPTTDKKNNAALIFVHGAGYLQNAHNWWSVYYHEYLFHNFLVQQGYTVLDMDYRASEGYGRDWRTGIYRHMGGKDLSDQVDGRTFLINEKGIDENRVGIYGGSYGGFITIMALLTEPGKFKCGAAIRSVTDWAHYNHEYTSNILNTPEEDSIAYRRSSPIYFAENLQDELLMLHGMVDDNVQFQDVVRLTQRFIEKGKDSFEMAVYPIEPHGFREASSWVDEYKRIFKLFEENLNQK